jgi:hypothetical protein
MGCHYVLIFKNKRQMISDETRQNSQRLPLKKIARFFFFVWSGQHIFVFPRSQLCLKFRQYAYRECRFAKTSTEARHPNSAGLAFALPFGQKGGIMRGDAAANRLALSDVHGGRSYFKCRRKP